MSFSKAERFSELTSSFNICAALSYGSSDGGNGIFAICAGSYYAY
jgi:hypothetical protein